MHTKTPKNYTTVFYNDSYVWGSGLRPNPKFFDIYEAAYAHFAFREMMRVDTRISMKEGPVIKITNAHFEVVMDVIKKFCRFSDVRQIDMRINIGDLDRWVEVPSNALVVRVPITSPFAMRWRNGQQSTSAAIWAFNVARNEFAVGSRVTHIYIPSNPDAEIPKFLQEKLTEKVDPKSSSQKVSGDCKAEVQSESEKADPESRIEDQIDEIKAAFVSGGGRGELIPGDLSATISEAFKKFTEWSQVTNAIAALGNPEIREAVFGKLIEDDKHELIKALFMDARSANYRVGLKANKRVHPFAGTHAPGDSDKIVKDCLRAKKNLNEYVRELIEGDDK